MNQPQVSVAMAVRNAERFLAEAIESILGQTFADFEFIIVDYGSIDKSKSIASDYAAKDIRIRFGEIPKCTLPEARNAASSLAQGRYIAVMDADDISLPDRLMLEIDFMEKHPEVGLLGAATEWIDATGRSLGIHGFPTQHQEIKSAFLTYCPFCHPTVLIRREAFLLVGGYRAVFTAAQDYDLGLRIAEHFQCANLKQVVLKYRIHPYQLSKHKRRLQILCKLAAQVSARSRRDGEPDPLNSVKEITSASLIALGVTEARQQSEFASECRLWIRALYGAGEYSVAFKEASEILQGDRAHVEPWQIADVHLSVSRLYWRQREFLKSLHAASHAVMSWPPMAGHLIKAVLRRLGLIGILCSKRQHSND